MSENFQQDIYEQKLLNNPYDFKSHLDYVEYLKSINNYTILSKQRMKFSTIFNLPAYFWKEWLTEIKENKCTDQPIETIYQFSIKHVPSDTDLWADYINHIIQSKKHNREFIENLFERAIKYAGFNNLKSHVIWDLYLHWIEEEYSDDEEIDEEEKVKNVYLRQLSVPKSNLQNVWNMYKEYEDDSDILEESQKIFEKSKGIYEQELNYEQIIAKDGGKIEKWVEYLNVRKVEKNVQRVISLYERFVAKFRLLDKIWIEYIHYLLMVNCESFQFVIEVCERATTSCHFSSEIWVLYLLIVSTHPSQQNVFNVYQKAISSGIETPTHFVQVFMVYSSYLRKRAYENPDNEEMKKQLISTIEQQIDHVRKFFPGFPKWELERFQAEIEGIHYGNVERGREIFNKILTNKKAKDSNIWLHFLNYERECKSEPTLIRLLFNRAIKEMPDHNKVTNMGKEWCLFESARGNSDSLLVAKRTIFFRVQKIEREKKPGRKRQRNEKYESNKKQKREFVEKRGKEKPKFENRRKFEKKKVEKKKVEKKEKLVLSGPGDEELTLFAWNLPQGIKEEKIKSLFEKQNCEIKEIRLIKTYQGKSKGYCYVEMSNKESVEKGLKLNNFSIGGKNIRVVPSKTKEDRKNKPKYKPRRGGFSGGGGRKRVFTSFTSHGKGKETKKLSNQDFKNFLK